MRESRQLPLQPELGHRDAPLPAPPRGKEPEVRRAPGVEMEESDYESVLCVKPEVHVYRIPPRATNRGYRYPPPPDLPPSPAAPTLPPRQPRTALINVGARARNSCGFFQVEAGVGVWGPRVSAISGDIRTLGCGEGVKVVLDVWGAPFSPTTRGRSSTLNLAVVGGGVTELCLAVPEAGSGLGAWLEAGASSPASAGGAALHPSTRQASAKTGLQVALGVSRERNWGLQRVCMFPATCVS